MNKLISLLKVLLYPILFMISQVLILFLFSLVFILLHPNIDLNASDTSFLIYRFIDNNTLLILFIESIIFIPIFHFVYKKNLLKREKLNISNALINGSIALGLSIFLNLILLMLKEQFGLNIVFSKLSLVTIISTGIIGPIIEELLFRGIVYGKLTKCFSDKLSLFMSSFIFAIFHTGGIFQIVFAFIIGLFLTIIYKKYGDIRLSILLHMIVNLTSIIGVPLLVNFI